MLQKILSSLSLTCLLHIYSVEYKCFFTVIVQRSFFFPILAVIFAFPALMAVTFPANNSANPKPTANQEYLYFKFKINYSSGSQTIRAKDVFNYHHNIFGLNC